MKQSLIAIICAGTTAILGTPIANGQTVAVANWSGLRENTCSIIYLSSSGGQWSGKIIHEGRALTIAFDRTGKSLVAVTIDNSKPYSSKVDVYDAASGNLSGSFTLDNFVITSFWLRDGPESPDNLLPLKDGNFALLGFQRDQGADKVCIVKISTQKELARKSLDAIDPSRPGVMGSPLSDMAVISAWARSGITSLPKMGLLQLDHAIEYREWNLPKDILSHGFIPAFVPDGLFVLCPDFSGYIFDGKNGSLVKQMKIQGGIPNADSPGLLAFDTAGANLLIQFNLNISKERRDYDDEYQDTGRSQLAILDSTKYTIALGPETDTIKEATFGPGDDSHPMIYTLPQKGSAMTIFSFPALKPVETVPLNASWPYKIIVNNLPSK